MTTGNPVHGPAGSRAGESDRTMKLTLLPAIDIVGGKAVRLVQGEAGTETEYGHPVEIARQFRDAGAEWIHLVDLDAAFGRGSNQDLLEQVIDATDLFVELSGGIRGEESLVRALDMGATRVNLGTAALENPDWTESAIRRFGDRVAVGLDVRGDTLAARGWTKEGGTLWETLMRLNMAGCARYVLTDVGRDGMLNGPNIELLERVAGRTDAPIVASGGVSSLEDIAALRTLVPIGVDSAIVGKALYAGKFTLEEALKVAAGQ